MLYGGSGKTHESTQFIHIQILFTMNIFDLMRLIMATFLKGSASTIIQQKILTEKEMNKGRGANRNPFLGGRVLMVKTFSGYVLGTDYTNSLVNAAKRMGNDVKREDVKLKKNWHKPCEGEFGEWFSTDVATESKCYLKLQRNEQQIAHKIETQYYLDGELATAEETRQIEAWLKHKDHSQSSTQKELNINEEHEQFFILPELKTITLIKQNEREIEPMAMLHEVEVAAYAAV